MNKGATTDGVLRYRTQARSALLLAAMIPVGWALNYYLEGSWAAYVVVTIIGLSGFVVGAFCETVVIDSARRIITCTKYFLWTITSSESIPFGAVTGVVVKPKYARTGEGQRRDRLEQIGFEIAVIWDAQWGGGGLALETFAEESDTRWEAERLADLLCVRVSVYTPPRSN